MRAWIGVDVGTSSAKAPVLNDDRNVLASGRHDMSWQPTAHGSHIHPDAICGTALTAMNIAAAASPAGTSVAGVGITSMGETGVLTRPSGESVTPAIAWYATRDTAEVAVLGQTSAKNASLTRTRAPMRARFTVPKHRWSVAHHSAASRAVRRLNVAQWVARRLGADELCERSLTCRTGWFDITTGAWDEDLLAWSGATTSLLPPLVQAGEPIGTVTTDDVHPLLNRAVLIVRGHDHQAAAVGVGALHVGSELDSSGTSEALVRAVRPDIGAAQLLWLTRAGVTVDLSIRSGLWSLLAGTEGGLAMQRAMRLLGETVATLPALDAAAAHADPMVAASVVGIGIGIGIGIQGVPISFGDGVGPEHVWLAVTDAATRDAFGLHTVMSALTGEHDSPIASGGWRASPIVMAAKRRYFGELAVSPETEPGAYGAALLARQACGQPAPSALTGGHT